MKKDALQDAEKYTKAHQRKKRWYRVVTALAGVVVFCTTYALILPALTLEKQCDIPEHQHTDACYAQVTSVEKRVPVCSAKTLGIHQHTADCYDSEGNLTCGYADFVVHQHDSACYDENGNLWCPLPEIETHEHTGSCYAVPETDAPEVHTHTDDCYTVERGELICTESTEPAHVHTDDCYTETSALVCEEDHEHTESCYETTRELTCGHTEEPAHQHTDQCYEQIKTLICELPTEPAEEAEPAEPELICEKKEIILHTHEPYESPEDPGCYDDDGNLICGKIQVLEHQHTDACFETVEEPADTETLTCTDTAHVHTARCYGTWKLVCGQEEHTHSKACTAVESEETVFCGKDAHTHGEACRDENGELVCGTEEHTHSLACYADPTADVETAEIWEQTFAGVTLTGNWRQDTLAIAETQLGYAESTKNYVVAEDGETVKGYTRYGAWCEEPYGDWNTMFLTFCLHYAGVEGVPPDRDCGGWVTSWADAFEPAQSHTPAVGDLVLFDRDGDGTADRAGLVAQITDSGFAAMEGDAEDAVRLLTYGADDPGILGYINLPEGAKEFTLTAQTENGITVTITGESASLPYPAREITVTATEVADGECRAIRDQILGEEQAEPEQSYLLDITLWHGEEEIEPTGSVTVTFSGIDTEGLYPKVYHIDTNAQTATDMEAEKTETGDVAVDTDHFSLYEVQALSFQGLSGYIGDKFSNGGEFKLTDDAWTADGDNRANLSITQNTTIDLNGYTLKISKSDQFFQVQNGATLTIIDSQAPQETVTTGGDKLYGNKAKLENDTLTYYITESTPDGTGTKETLKQHTVTLTGVIQCGDNSDQAIKVNNGGTLHIQSGALRNSNGRRVVQMENGTLTMDGGYIVGGGNNNYDNGGGVYAKNGTVNISGGVIAANSGTKGGGICMEGGSFTMSDGVISGNQTRGDAHTGNWDTGLGGGVFAQDTTVTISGGYITNNRENAKCEQNGFGCHGGGGIATRGGNIAMQGGFVTGNYSEEAGGGMYIGHANYGNSAAFTMTGGIVAGNVANQSEGGGIRVSGKTNGSIQASDRVYITNNTTNTTFDWGGGGIFVQAKGNLNITNALITANTAGGYGGGVAACPTGETLITHTEGAAIYGNSDSGEHMSGGGNGKNADSEVAKANGTFTSNGHKDYFCVRSGGNDPISLVTGEMLGGGAANWTGSSDGTYITISKTGYATANYLFGLAASPDSEAINAAKGAARVIITGNRSNIHGGGIMTNGGLILGKKEEIVTATPALDITGTKALLKDGVAQESGRDFQFQLKNEAGAVVGTAIANAATGQFTILPNVQYTQAGTYTYYLTEVNDGEPGVTYDSSTYQIDVTVQSDSQTLAGVTFTRHYVGNVTVTKTGGNTPDSGETVSNNNTFKIHFNNSDNWSNVYLHTWNSGEIQSTEDSWPGVQVSRDSTLGWYTKEFPVNGDGNFNYIFNDGGNNKTGDLSGHYQPGGDLWVYRDGTSTTTAPAGWNGSSSGSNVSFTGTPDSEGSYTLTINGAAFTNTMTTRLDLQITKTDSVHAEKKLEGAKFTLTRVGTENAEGPLPATTNKKGIATFSGIQRGATYELRETTPPSGYMTAGPWILEVRSEDATLYPATEKSDGTLVKSKETGTTLTVTGTDPKVLPVTVSDISWGYELPDTGGAGTTSYTAGGLTLIFGAATLLYSHCRRRKEDEASS